LTFPGITISRSNLGGAKRVACVGRMRIELKILICHSAYLGVGRDVTLIF